MCLCSGRPDEGLLGSLSRKGEAEAQQLAICAKCEEQKLLISALCEKLEAKAREVQGLADEREKGDNTLLQAKRELRQSRLRLTEVMGDLDKVRVAGGQGVRLVWRCKGQLSSLADEVSELRERNERLERDQRSEEIARRRLHNAVQELKGNIRVYCRIRPLVGEQERHGGGVVAPSSQGRKGRTSLMGESLEIAPVEVRSARSFERRGARCSLNACKCLYRGWLMLSRRRRGGVSTEAESRGGALVQL